MLFMFVKRFGDIHRDAKAVNLLSRLEGHSEFEAVIKEGAVGIDAEAFVSDNTLYVLGAYNTGTNAAIVAGNDPFANGDYQRRPRKLRVSTRNGRGIVHLLRLDDSAL